MKCSGCDFIFLVQAETASLIIPELEFEVKPGTLGGRFSTIEGILSSIKQQLSRDNPFATGDASIGSKMSEFIKKLEDVSVCVCVPGCYVMVLILVRLLKVENWTFTLYWTIQLAIATYRLIIMCSQLTTLIGGNYLYVHQYCMHNTCRETSDI